jgi:hypothetical protein
VFCLLRKLRLLRVWLGHIAAVSQKEWLSVENSGSSIGFCRSQWPPHLQIQSPTASAFCLSTTELATTSPRHWQLRLPLTMMDMTWRLSRIKSIKSSLALTA